ncbi:MAG TPA: hypothetical protein VJ598_03110 [Albitalea sp.]|nr:hypothetical protein [Albitalea sp.]
MSSAAPPEPAATAVGPPTPTLFIDRDTWSHRLDAALREAGIPFVAHRSLFEPDTPDTTWIAEVGRRGWVVVTRDQEIRRRPNELRAVRDAGLHLFALTSGNLSAADTAAVIAKAWPSIQRWVAHTLPPALFSITRSGEVRQIDR